jgi:hypothetical protein
MGALKSIASILAAIVALIVLGFIALAWWNDHSAKSLAVKEEAAAGAASVSAGQAQAQTNAIQIQVAGQARDRVDLEVHQANDQAIATSPGAAQSVDPRLNRVGLVGLCRHLAYATDPECAELRSPDPTQRPDAGGGNAVAAS